MPDWQLTLAQVSVPTGDTAVWPWVAGMAALAASYLGKELLASERTEKAEWKGQAKTLTTELARNTDAVSALTDVTERNRQTNEELVADIADIASSVATLAGTISRLEGTVVDLMEPPPAPRSRGDR